MFAHGARDPRWAEPFLRVADRVPAGVPGVPVEFAYLEFMTPTRGEAVQRPVAREARKFRVVPRSFGAGGHLRDDVPEFVRCAMAATPGVSIELAPAAGKDDDDVAALAGYWRRQG